MTPMEACLYLGIKKTFMLPLDVPVSMRQYNKSFKTLNEVGWPISDNDYVFDMDQKPELVEQIIQEAKDFKNITSVVFDDFQRDGKYKDINVDNLFHIQERLHNNEVRPLDMWMVLYTHEFGHQPGEHEIYDDVRFQPYIAPFDGVIMWTWCEKDVVLIPEKYEIFKKMTEGKRRMFGCYLWDFGDKKEATAEAVTWQLDWYREKIMAGEAEGVVFHTNTMADLDYEAYDAALAWMELHRKKQENRRWHLKAGAPSNHDINMMIHGEWDEVKNFRANAYVAGVEAFWHGNIGFEKSPEYKLTAATSLFQFDPEKEHNLKLGNVGNKIFVVVDEELCLEITDPDPLDIWKYGKIGFEAFSSWWKFKDLKVYQLKYDKFYEYYNPEF